MLVLVPVATVAWLYGFLPGLAAGFLSLFVNLLLFQVHGVDWYARLVHTSGLLQGSCAIVLIGGMMGRVSDLSRRLKKELLEKSIMEDQLRHHRDDLQKKMHDQTEKLRASNKMLAAAEQQLRAANQELESNYQQLKASQEDAQRANEFLENMLQGAFDGIIVSDAKGYIVRTNRALEQMVGYSKDEIKGKHMAEFAPSEQKYIDIAGHMMSALREKGFVENCETCFLGKDGSLCPVEFNCSYVKDASGTVTGAFSVVRDITERKKVEKEIREAKNFLENILRSTIDGLVVTDAKGYVIRTNEVLDQMLGYEKGELFGRHVGELGPLEQPYTDIAVKMMNILRERDFVENHETAWLRKDGSLCPVEFNIGYVKDEDGTILGAVGGIRDISQRKRAEHEIKESRDYFEAVIEGSRDGIILTDDKGMIKLVNGAIEQMFGFGRNELIGQHASMLVVEDKEVRKKALDATAELFEKGYTTYETIHKAKDGRLLEVECIVSMIRDEQGNYVASAAILRDISDRKRMEQQLRQSQKMEAIGTLAGGIAHDFNNILAAIIGFTEIAQAKVPGDTAVKDTLDQVLKAAERATNLVKQILAFSRKSDHDRRPVSLHLTVLEVLKLLRASLPTTIEIRHDLKKLNDMVQADSIQLHQVIMNLCTNAAHAMQEQGGTLEIALSPVDLDEEGANACVDLRPGPYVQLMVRDTGTGITPEIMDRIFDPFFTTKEVGKGTGMGLAVVHGIVKSHGGAIRVSSEPGQGSAFYVLLPRIEAEPVAPSAAAANKLFPQGTERILFVDDEEMLNDMAMTLLKSLGYAVTVKQNSFEALEAFQRDPSQFDLVITDQTMPGMTGDLLAKKIMELRPDIPVILCTGYSEKVSEEKARELGIQAFIMKPISLGELSETIRKILDKTGYSSRDG